MERVERPVSVGVAAALTWISAALLGVCALATGMPVGGPPVHWAVVAVLWLLTGALAVSAFGIGRQRRALRPLATITLTTVVILLAPTAAGPYLLLNVVALALLIVNNPRGHGAKRRRPARTRAGIRFGGAFSIEYVCLAAGRYLREYRIDYFHLRLCGDPDRRVRGR
ncbi:MAG TPA: hypothetical protein VKA76_08935 [Gammaproteobacteria bacterium]|nr:hypothetical protein [Gammaproteobacteria bacterium]